MMFWLCLGTSALLFATVVAAPRISEWKRLERRWLRSSSQIRELKADIQHLQLLKDSMQNDAEFAARVAQDELNLSSRRGQLVHVDASLGFDPRKRQVTVGELPLSEAWYEPWLMALSKPTTLRSRWLTATGILCLVSFVLLHENAFSGRMAMGGGDVIGGLLRRYTSGEGPDQNSDATRLESP